MNYVSIWLVCLGPLPICLLSPCRGLRASKREKPVVFLSFFSCLDMEFSCFFLVFTANMDLLWWLSGKNRPASAGDTGDVGLIPGLGRSPGGGHANPLQYSCQENSHGQRILVGYSPWGYKESDRTEATEHVCAHTYTYTHTHTLLTWI